jgi:iron complex outermembrane receptor protein
MKNGFVSLSLCLLSAPWGVCQQSSSDAGTAVAAPGIAQSQAPVRVAQSVQVTTTAEPLPLDESDRSVSVLLPQDGVVGTDSVVDLLRGDPSLNVQARAGEGVQADLAIRGTTFEQSLVLVNGMRVDDPETGHLNLDIPVPLDAISRVDVLHGSGSTFYGSDAIGGAVNLLTGAPGAGLSVAARSGAGNYGSLEEHLRVGYSAGPFAEQLTGSRDTSDGFIADRNYSSNALASESWLKTKPGTTDVLLAASDRPYGANQFYGAYNSWERTKAWLASIQQELGKKTAASFGYLRHTDEFVLLEGLPAIYENNHITTSYEGALRRADELGRNTTLAYGVEESGDSIHSFNFSGGVLSNALGVHARNQGAGYANLSLRALRRFSLSVGAREEVLSGGDSVFSPSAAAAFTLSKTLRLRGSAGHGFRLPTYTDLYYSDPATLGNAALKPESSWSYEGGLDWKPANGRLTLTTAGFRLQETNAIDYSKLLPLTAGEQWQAVNVPTLDISGAEASARVRLSSTEQIDVSYTAAHSGNLPANYLSEYAFNYAAQNAVFGWTGQFKQLSAHTQVEVVQKTTQTAYPLWDASLARNTGSIRPYLRLLNLSNTGYTEIVGVPMQGRTVMGGMEWSWRAR